MRSIGYLLSATLTVLCCLLFLASPAMAATITWTGAVSNSWHTAGNWNLNRVPGAGDDVRISNLAGASVNYTNAVTTSINSLTCGEVLNISAGTLTIASSSRITNAVTMSGGTMNGAGAVSIDADFTWTGGTLGGTGALSVEAGHTWYVDPGVAKLLTRTANCRGVGKLSSALTITSPGNLFIAPGAEMTLGDFVISGTGLITVQALGFLVKSGAGTGFINCTLSNSGTVRASSGTLFVNGFANYSAGTLTGGTFDVDGIFQYDSGGITALAASIILDGTGQFLDSSGINAFLNLLTITTSGTLTLDNGNDLSISGDLDMSGRVTVRSIGTTLAIDDRYTQFGGLTELDGGTLSCAQGIVIQAGLLQGRGTIVGALSNHSTIAPGFSAGAIAVTGTYTQHATGRIEIEVGGIVPGTGFDRLSVSGTATLNGTLDVSVLNGFLFPDGVNYTILTCASRNGTFSSHNLPLGAGTECVDLTYTPSGVQLMNVPCPDTFYVKASAPAGGNGQDWTTAFNNLQTALTAAMNHGGHADVWVAEATYTPSVATRSTAFALRSKVALYGGFQGGEAQLASRRPEEHPTILSGDLAGNDLPGFANNGENSLHVVVGSGTDSTAILDGFTIQGGNANQLGSSDGGGILVSGSGRPTIRNCIVTGNVANSSGGGMMLALGGSARIQECTFSGNQSTGGGGLCFTNGSVAPLLENCRFLDNAASTVGGGAIIGGPTVTTVRACEFRDNTASSATGHGGGLVISGNASTLVTLLDCDFFSNSITVSGTSTGPARGGALSVFNGARAALTRCLFVDNSVTATAGPVRGGAAALLGTISTFNECRFYGNQASSGDDASGGAVATLSTGGAGVFINCLFSGNIATQTAGGVEVNGTATTEFRNCTLSRNGSGVSAGGIRVSSSGPVQVLNSILWGNHVNGVENLFTQIAFPGTSLGSSNFNNSIVFAWNPIYPGTGNFSADPLFFDRLGADGLAGTVDDFLHLLPGSPAIDSGNDGNVPAGTTVDLARRNRFMNDACKTDTGIGGAPIVDRGAYEYQGTCVTGVGDVATTSEGPPFAPGFPAPNPASDKTRLSFDLRRESVVTADVFDVAGRRIRRLCDQSLEAGRHELSWDGADASGRRVADGLYFIRLEAAGIVATRKVIVR